MLIFRYIFITLCMSSFQYSIVKSITHNVKTSCDANDANIIAKYFYYLITDKTRCPLETWLLSFRDADPKPNKLIIDIGFNKGFNFALWLSLWRPDLKVNVHTWHRTLKEMGIKECGICKDCKSRLVKFKKTTSSTTKLNVKKDPRFFLRMIGVDINPNNLRIVENVTMSLKLKELQRPDRVSWSDIKIETMHAAATSDNRRIL